MKGKRPALILSTLGLLSLLAELFLTERHAAFVWEQWPGFYAAFGFVACSLWALTARFLVRPLVMRKEAESEVDS